MADLVRRHCQYAGQLADALREEPGILVHNQVRLNQVLLSFGTGTGDNDAVTDMVIDALRQENAVFVEGATWKGRRVMRVSIVSHETGADDIAYLAASIVRNARAQPVSGSDRRAVP